MNIMTITGILTVINTIVIPTSTRGILTIKRSIRKSTRKSITRRNTIRKNTRNTRNIKSIKSIKRNIRTTTKHSLLKFKDYVILIGDFKL
jgi:lipopolysaccharide export LptBFGC system permease protein LptF